MGDLDVRIAEDKFIGGKAAQLVNEGVPTPRLARSGKIHDPEGMRHIQSLDRGSRPCNCGVGAAVGKDVQPDVN